MPNKELENNYKGEEDNYSNGNYKKRNSRDQLLKEKPNSNVYKNRDQLDSKDKDKKNKK